LGNVAEEVQQRVHTHLAGDFTGSLPAHAITNHKDAVAGVIAEVVFIIGAHATNIALPRDL
jgi:hypothetical protein